MTNYANGDTGSDRAYEYEQERDGVEAENFEAYCDDNGLDPDEDSSILAYRAWVREMENAELMTNGLVGY